MAEGFTPFEINEEQKRLFVSMNPLRGLNSKDVESILDMSRRGFFSRLALIYSILESSDINVSTILTRRESALVGCDWEIRKRKVKDMDEKLAKDQQEFLTEQFSIAEDSGTLIDAIKALQLSTFRGIAVVEPRYTKNGLYDFVCYDTWNFAVDPATQRVYWNPKAQDYTNFSSLKDVTDTNLIIMRNERPVDGLTLPVYIRSEFGEESWSRLVARRGLPNCYIIAPPLSDNKIDAFANAAKKCADGGSGALPNGSSVVTEKTDPGNHQAFQLFLEHQQKQIILAGTGGILGSLAEATGLGSGVSNAHMETWREIITSDAFSISNAISRKVANKLLDWKFPGQRHLAYFAIDTDTPKTAAEVLDCAVKATQAGYRIDTEQLAEMTGFKFVVENRGTSEQETPRTPTNTDEEKPDETPVEEVKEETKEEEKVVENTAPSAEEDPDVPRMSEEEIKEEESAKDKAVLLKAFDLVMNPIRALVAKLMGTTEKDEVHEIIEAIKAETKRIENQEENEYIAAVHDYMAHIEEERKENE